MQTTPTAANASAPLGTLPHASRTVPVCANCRHVVFGKCVGLLCNHPSTAIDAVMGAPEWRAALCREAPTDGGQGLCGPLGLLFEPIAQRVGDL